MKNPNTSEVNQECYAPEWYVQVVQELKELSKEVSHFSSFSSEEWGKIEGMLYQGTV